MNIVLTNDDGFDAKGIKVLANILRPYGKLTIVAPKYHQSGMSMACSMGMKPIAVKTISQTESERWIYVDGTPSTCIKWAIDEVFTDEKIDVVVSGINHGANYASAVLYSGTIGAAKEAVLADIPAIGVSLDDMHNDADFSQVEKYFPAIFESILNNLSARRGVLYNVNFPKGDCIKGVRAARQGRNRWVKEFEPYDMSFFEKWGTTPEKMGVHFPPVEEGEKVYMMVGKPENDEKNTADCDNILIARGYITVTVQNIDYTDFEALAESGYLNEDFKQD